MCSNISKHHHEPDVNMAPCCPQHHNSYTLLATCQLLVFYVRCYPIASVFPGEVHGCCPLLVVHSPLSLPAILLITYLLAVAAPLNIDAVSNSGLLAFQAVAAYCALL